MLPHAGHLFQFIELVFREKYRYLVLFHFFSSAASFPFTLIHTHTHTHTAFICSHLIFCSLLCRDESVTKAAVAVMGDLADALGPNTKILFKDKAFCVQFLGECLQSEDEHLKETANWTQVMIARVVS
jgi:importin subunit beta-1